MRPFIVFTLLSLAATASHAADQARTVPPFTSVSNSGPISVVIEVGETQSVTASGNDTFLRELATEVVDGELRIKMKDHSLTGSLGDPKVVVSVPQLVRYRMSGAGDTTVSHLSGDRLEVDVSGAGSLLASGDVKVLRMTLSGVGSIDARALHAGSADVEVAGVGSVKVYATDSLKASVGGVGSLTYYGNPRSVDTHGGGIGSISRGK